MSLRPLAMYNDDVHMESYSLKWKNINEKKIWTIDLIKVFQTNFGMKRACNYLD